MTWIFLLKGNKSRMICRILTGGGDAEVKLSYNGKGFMKR
jgi:hypothetical protein